MINSAVNDYGVNWISQLVTVDEMNIQLSQLLNNSTYLTDQLTPCVYYGGQVTPVTSTTINVTAGVFRLPDATTTWTSPFNVTPVFYKCPTVTLTASTNGTYYIVARLAANTTDPNFIIYSGSFVLVATGSYAPTTDVKLASVVVAGSVVTVISYDNGDRANDLSQIFTPTVTQTLTTDTTLTTVAGKYYIATSTATPFTITLPNINGLLGYRYNKFPFVFVNNSPTLVTLIPNATPASSTILGETSYVLPQLTTLSLSYDVNVNMWYLN